MLQLLVGYLMVGESGVPDADRINKGLDKIKPNLTPREGSDGKIKPGLSV